MKKKFSDVIALSCSPSVGRNSDTMLDHFIRGMKKRARNKLKVEKVHLNDIPIDFYAYENSKRPGPHEKEFAELCEKIQNSSALVIATPTYNFSVPAGLKNFVDRIRFLALDMENKNKFGQPKGKLKYLRFYSLASGGTPKWAQKIIFFAFPCFWLRGVFLYFGANHIGSYYSGDINTFRNKKILAVCERRGMKFAEKVIMEKPKSILKAMFWRAPQNIRE
jgi:multimeric flavodoxin WrbA